MFEQYVQMKTSVAIPWILFVISRPGFIGFARDGKKSEKGVKTFS
jgi:hypothetical protein